MIYRYIYKITCTTGSFKDKFYYGKHTTENLDDGYIGSGVMLMKYYKKHPNEFIKEIIAFYNSEEDLNKAEYDIIHPHLYNDMCLNLAEGGKGGKIKGVYKHTEETKRKQSKGQAGKDGHFKGHKHTEESKLKTSKSLKGKRTGEANYMYKIGINHPMYGKHHSDKSKAKISEGNKGKVRTEAAKQKWREATSKKRWVYKDNEPPEYVNVDKLEYYLSLGYKRGRGSFKPWNKCM